MLKHYISIARPDHWFKNIFILPGIFLALLQTNTDFTTTHLILTIVGFMSTCFISSANYVINEKLDARYDKFHPIKKNRPSVIVNLNMKYVLFEYLMLAALGLMLGYFFINTQFSLFGLALFIMGIFYNIEPLRLKDKPYLDVFSESINNPLRFCLGWYIITNAIPPSSILISYWMGGAFLMGTKRFAEYRFINDAKIACKYRKSFGFYNEARLLISIFFYALVSVFFLGIYLVKYRVEFILTFPFFALLFCFYLRLAMKDNSPVQQPEKLYKEKGFIAYLVLLIIICLVLYVVDIKLIHLLF